MSGRRFERCSLSHLGEDFPRAGGKREEEEFGGESEEDGGDISLLSTSAPFVRVGRKLREKYAEIKKQNISFSCIKSGVTF